MGVLFFVDGYLPSFSPVSKDRDFFVLISSTLVGDAMEGFDKAIVGLNGDPLEDEGDIGVDDPDDLALFLCPALASFVQLHRLELKISGSLALFFVWILSIFGRLKRLRYRNKSKGLQSFDFLLFFSLPP